MVKAQVLFCIFLKLKKIKNKINKYVHNNWFNLYQSDSSSTCSFWVVTKMMVYAVVQFLAKRWVVAIFFIPKSKLQFWSLCFTAIPHFAGLVQVLFFVANLTLASFCLGFGPWVVKSNCSSYFFFLKMTILTFVTLLCIFQL